VVAEVAPPPDPDIDEGPATLWVQPTVASATTRAGILDIVRAYFFTKVPFLDCVD
jgi:hypothetical protein